MIIYAADRGASPRIWLTGGRRAGLPPAVGLEMVEQPLGRHEISKRFSRFCSFGNRPRSFSNICEGLKLKKDISGEATLLVIVI